jgi:DMSO/TMAO reductase YedYZ molybdopterin-dependent catalytic subunit
MVRAGLGAAPAPGPEFPVACTFAVKKLLIADFYPAALGGLVAIAAAIVLRTLIGTRLLAELVLDATLGFLPGESFSTLLGVFGPYGKALFFASTLLAILAFFIVVWARSKRRLGLSSEAVTRIALLAGIAAFALPLLASVLLVLLTDAVLRGTSWLEYAFVTALTAGLFAGVAGLQTLSATASEYDRLQIDSPPESDGRRRVLQLVPGLALGGLAIMVIARTLRDAAGGGVQSSHRGEPTLPVTPTDEFYVVSKNLIDPQVEESKWALHVSGLVGTRVDLTYEQFVAFPAQEQYTTMQCISNEVGGELMGNALWRGVPLNQLLAQAGLLADASHVLFRCADGYTVSIPIEFALRDQVVLAYQMNGAPLTDKHGFPVRLLTPGIYGMMHPKWITDILVMNEEVLGYWQQQGWSQEARMNTSVRVDLPGGGSRIAAGAPYLIEGVAFSGDRGISRVEVSTDGGQTWGDAKLKPPLGPYTWVLWDFAWSPPGDLRGRINLQARATDGDGALQTAEELPPYPDGATGYHTVDVTIEQPAPSAS